MVRNKHNTSGIIKLPFWQMTMRNPRATYACINMGEAFCPQEIAGQSICIEGDIGNGLSQLFEVSSAKERSALKNILAPVRSSR